MGGRLLKKDLKHSNGGISADHAGAPFCGGGVRGGGVRVRAALSDRWHKAE